MMYKKTEGDFGNMLKSKRLIGTTLFDCLMIDVSSIGNRLFGMEKNKRLYRSKDDEAKKKRKKKT